MSLFENSFEKEVGKNTGKWVSNLVFGDGHSTPYRRVGPNVQEMRHQQRMIQVDLENKRLQKEHILSIDSAVLKNVDYVALIKIPNDKTHLIDLLSELGTQIKANKWYLNTEEGKVRNKYCEALLEKYTQATERLKSINPNDSQLEYYEKIGTKFKYKGYLTKLLPYIIGLILIVVFLIYSLITYLDEKGLLGIVFGIISFLSVAIIGYKFYRLNQNSETSKATNIQKASEEKLTDEATIDNTKNIEESIFFDLNENEKIEKKLSEIWIKYNDKVDKRIIARKPIFSADGVTDSVLFVGINPSFNPLDDDNLIKSNDENSLMYGSFYQRPDAPEYFKKLEYFANRISNGVSKGYTQINLLYARENDRDFLMNSNPDFIREQLELTYESILKIKPIAILFFGDYCKDLIYGAERWVNPNAGSNGCYILKGTNVPVFFTNDVTEITIKEQIELILKVEKAI